MTLTALAPLGYSLTSRRSRLAFHWRAADLSLDPITDQAETFARATASGLVPDRVGRLVASRVHSAPVWEMADLDADGVYETPGLRLEPQRTNLILRSQEIDNASWTKTDTTITANNIAAPDGTTTADLCTEGVAGTALVFQSVTVTAGTVVAASVFAKRGNTDWLAVRLEDAGGSDTLHAWFNLSTGAVGSNSVGGTAALKRAHVETLASGWYRLIIVGSLGAADTGYILHTHSASADSSLTRVNSATYYLWGAMLEEGRMASSYVATTSASVTKNADALQWTFSQLPQLLTLYGSIRTNTGSEATSDLVLANLGNGTPGGTAASLLVSSHNNLLYLYVANGSATNSNSIASTYVPGDQLEFRAVLNANGSGTLGRSINSGAEATAAVTAPTGGIATAFNAARIDPASTHLCMYRSLKVALGAAYTMAQMRSFF